MDHAKALAHRQSAAAYASTIADFYPGCGVVVVINDPNNDTAGNIHTAVGAAACKIPDLELAAETIMKMGGAIERTGCPKCDASSDRQRDTVLWLHAARGQTPAGKC